MKESVTGCTHCGVCTENCEFLKKYDLTIGDTEKLSKMAYHCFLCGKCSKVCPQGIDGREIVLQIRRHRVKEAGGRIPEKGYGMLLWEKEDYKFRRYTGTGKTALFFGCNFPSFYPETTRYLGKLLAEKADAFSVFDCCGKPIAELGLEEKETVILERLNKKAPGSGGKRSGYGLSKLLCFFERQTFCSGDQYLRKITGTGAGKQDHGRAEYFPSMSGT